MGGATEHATRNPVPLPGTARGENRRLDRILLLAAICALLLPWYKIRGGIIAFDWLADLADKPDLWPAAVRAAVGRWQILPLLCLIVTAAILRRRRQPGPDRGRWLQAIGALGLVWLTIQGLAIGMRGWNWGLFESLLGDIPGQLAFGAGAVGLGLFFTCLMSFGASERGALKGDAFVLTSIALLMLLVTVFVLYPILSIFTGAFQDFEGSFTSVGVRRNIVDAKIWSLACLGGGSCGVAWRTLFLAICTATASTLLGLAFALVATRTRFPFKKGLRLLTVLPIITPPFVVGLGRRQKMRRLVSSPRSMPASKTSRMAMSFLSGMGVSAHSCSAPSPASGLICALIRDPVAAGAGLNLILQHAGHCTLGDRWKH